MRNQNGMVQGVGKDFRILFEVGFAIYGIGLAETAMSVVLVGIGLRMKGYRLYGLGNVTTTCKIVPLTGIFFHVSGIGISHFWLSESEDSEPRWRKRCGQIRGIST